MGRVFIMDDKKPRRDSYSHLLESRGLEVFATGNAYKLVKYAKELSPDLYVLSSDMQDVDSARLVKHLAENHFIDSAPLVLVGKPRRAMAHPEISHYLQPTRDIALLPDIAQAYCAGGREYDFLLLNRRFPVAPKMQKIRNSAELSLFEVSSVRAANIFLRKNRVKAVGVLCEASEYKDLCRSLNFKNTFYVDKPANVRDLHSFLA